MLSPGPNSNITFPCKLLTNAELVICLSITFIAYSLLNNYKYKMSCLMDLLQLYPKEL